MNKQNHHFHPSPHFPSPLFPLTPSINLSSFPSHSSSFPCFQFTHLTFRLSLRLPPFTFPQSPRLPPFTFPQSPRLSLPLLPLNPLVSPFSYLPSIPSSLSLPLPSLCVPSPPSLPSPSLYPSLPPLIFPLYPLVPLSPPQRPSAFQDIPALSRGLI